MKISKLLNKKLTQMKKVLATNFLKLSLLRILVFKRKIKKKMMLLDLEDNKILKLKMKKLKINLM